MSEYIISTINMPEHVRETINTWCDVSCEIVRCRDCEHLNIVGKCPCGFWALENPDGFCAWAERREEA